MGAVTIAQVHTPDKDLTKFQQNVKKAVEPVFSSISGAFLAQLSGCVTLPTAMAKWQMASSLGQATLLLPTLVGTSNALTAVISGLPQQLWPKSIQTVLGMVEDNGTVSVLPIQIQPTGSIVLFKTFTSSSTFTASGSKGVLSCCLTYLLGM